MTSQFLEQERKKLKKEWEALADPKLTWEQFKRQKQKKTFKQLIVNEKTPNKKRIRETLTMNEKTPNNFIAREAKSVDESFIPYTIESFIESMNNGVYYIDYQI